MSLGRIVAFAIAASVFAWGSADAAGPLRPFKVGLWSGGAYTDDRSGSFTHCSAGVAYDSGINMFVLLTGGYRWWLGFTDPHWAWSPTAGLKVELRFDNNAPFLRVATVPNGQLLLVPLPQKLRLIEPLRRSAQLTLIAEGESFRFSLDGAPAVLDNLTGCVRRSVMLAAATGPGAAPSSASPSSDSRSSSLAASVSEMSSPAAALPGAAMSSILAPGPQAAREPPASAAGKIPAASISPLAPEAAVPMPPTTLEEIRLAQDFLATAQLPNARLVVTDKPPALASFGAVWRSDNAAGAVKIIPPGPSVSAIAMASNLIAVDPRMCNGDFATARSSATIDGSVVFSAILSCTEADEKRTAQYFITSRRQGGLVAFAVIGSSRAGDGAAGSTQQTLDLFTKAAVRAAENDG
jgi:hypothetical protein